MPHHVVAIVNPISGPRNMLPAVRAVEEILQRNGSRFEVLLTTCAGHATSLASSLPQDVNALLIVGGDGTVSEVVNGLRARAVPIVILRTGTANLLARELGMPATPEGIARTILQGQPVSLDSGVINGRRFLAVAGVGFDAECVRRVTQARRGHITHADYFWPVWRTFFGHRFPMLHVEADGQPFFSGRGLAFIGIIGDYGGFIRILSDAKYDDGLLDLCVFPCASRRTLTCHAYRCFLKRHMGRGGVIYGQCRRIHIHSPEEVPVQIDGDPGGVLPVQVSIEAGGATFLRMPQDRPGY